MIILEDEERRRIALWCIEEIAALKVIVEELKKINAAPVVLQKYDREMNALAIVASKMDVEVSTLQG